MFSDMTKDVDQSRDVRKSESGGDTQAGRSRVGRASVAPPNKLLKLTPALQVVFVALVQRGRG